MSNTVKDSAIKKLKLLFTVVDRQKGEFYLDVISQFDVNCQIAMAGLGTATSELVELLGFRGIIAERRAEKRAMKRILDADDQQIINFM